MIERARGVPPEGAGADDRYRLWPPRPRVLAAGAVAGVVALATLGGFAYAGGFLTPAGLTQTRIVDGFEAANGVHPGFRRNHAKGVCVTGSFESNGNGAALSRAAVFRPGSVPVVGRFAFAGGHPFVPDAGTLVRSLAISFRPPGGEEWRTGMIDIPVFPFKDAHDFYEQMLSTAPDPATGKPDPAKIGAFFAAHPESAAAIALIKAHPFSSGFADETYNALNAFVFVDAAGVRTPVRWSVEAVDPFVALDPAAKPPQDDPNYLFDALTQRIETGPASWRLVATIGEPGDPTVDATLPWPAERRRVDLGTVTFTAIESEGPGNCRDINYDPTVVPDGIALSDDPLLSARAAAYSVSFTRREGEKKTPSAVQVLPGEIAPAGVGG